MTIPINRLASELRLDDKRVIADARCEGLHVTGPADHIPIPIACRIRAKYRRTQTHQPGLPRYRNPVGARPGLKDEFRKLGGLTAEEIEFLLSIV